MSTSRCSARRPTCGTRAEHRQTIGLHMEELVQRVEPLLVEREVRLERLKPERDVADARLERPDPRGVAVDFAAKRLLLLVLAGRACSAAWRSANRADAFRPESSTRAPASPPQAGAGVRAATSPHTGGVFTFGSATPRGVIERAERDRGRLPERADELAVVGIVHLAGAMVELELLQRRERTVPLLDEREPASLGLARRIEAVVVGDRLAQERQRDEHHHRGSQHEPDDDHARRLRAAPRAAAARARPATAPRPSRTGTRSRQSRSG